MADQMPESVSVEPVIPRDYKPKRATLELEFADAESLYQWVLKARRGKLLPKDATIGSVINVTMALHFVEPKNEA